MAPMKTQLSFAPLAGIETELLAVLAVDAQTSKEADAQPQPVLLTADGTVLATAAAVLASGEFKAGANETLLLHAPAGVTAKRLLLVGLGKRAKIAVHGVRSAAGTAVRFAKPRGIRSLVFALPEEPFAQAERAYVTAESALAKPKEALLPPGPCIRAAVAPTAAYKNDRVRWL